MKPKITLITLAALALQVLMPIRALSKTNDFSPQSFSVFGLPQNLGMQVNSAENESGACLSPNGLSIYFSSTRAGTLGNHDLWVSQRTSLTAAWGAPQNLGILNTGNIENFPTLSADGKTLFYNSDGLGGSGGQDLFMTTRTNPADDSGWTAPVNLGAVVNTSADEVSAGYFEDPEAGTAILYFTSNRTGGEDLYQSTRNPDGTFNASTNVTVLNSVANDRGMNVRRDGLEAYFASDRAGGSGGRDIYVSTRASVSSPWNTPVNLAAVNSTGTDQAPSLSADGSILYIASTRDGSQDIYTATRVSINRTPTADFDGDSRSDVSVFRPSDGTWHILQSGTNTYTVSQFGANGDKVVAGDYDGDGRFDAAVFRPSSGNWYVLRSSDGGWSVTNWGISTDKPVPGDYDGDGRTDMAVYRNGTWYIKQSSTGTNSYQQFGLSTDIPIVAGN